MSHTQRLGAVGIGVEATPGTAVTPTHWIQFEGSPSINDKYEYQNVESGRGRVEKSSNQKLMKTYGEGSVEMILDETVSVIPFGLILGSVASASAGGGKYDHTITINNTNTAKSATVVIDRVQDIRTFPYGVIKQVDLKVSDGFATLKMDLESKESATGAASESYSTVTNFSFKELAAQFGSDVTAANSASATPLSGVDLTIKRDVERIYQSGSTSPQKLAYKSMETSGNYSLLFEGATDRDKYLANTANALILTFTDASSNYIKITLPKIMISNWEPSNALDDIVTQSADFTAHYDSGQTESIRAVVRNTTETYTNLSA
jgi:hypothetical protein